jgi:hypothetical protein
MVSLLVVKAHADGRAHEGGGGIVATSGTGEATTAATSELGRAVLGRAGPLRRLLGGHTVSVGRRVLLELLGRLLRAVLGRRLLLLLLLLLIRLRSVVRVVVLRRQRSGLGRRLHRTVLRRAVLRMRLSLPLGTRVTSLRNRRTSLRAWDLRAEVRARILRVVSSRRALRRSVITSWVWIGSRRVRTTASASTRTTTARRPLMLRISVLRVRLAIVLGRLARRRRRGRRGELVLLVARHPLSMMQLTPRREAS